MRPRRAAVIVVAVASALLSGCVSTTHPNGTVICGTHIATGANSILPDLLQNPGPSPAKGPAPTSDRLPPQVPITSVAAPLSYVQVSSSCEHGAIVVVTPANTAKLGLVIRAGDHAVTVLGLALDGPVTVQAWQNGVFLGSLKLPGFPPPSPSTIVSAGKVGPDTQRHHSKRIVHA